MILNISHDDKRKYRENLKKDKTRARTNRSRLLSSKIKDEAFKKLDALTVDAKTGKTSDIQIDEHVKMNDNFMRTGPYRPKKK
ncbi:MAG: hypothetical protein JSU88_01770 [Nitrospinaceae bacterium]|jgi:hypothetical protein|nr:MAG: hypothetical protein JSU88_01770 [Nitrospinaceae bacterium]